jgi:cytochrome P450
MDTRHSSLLTRVKGELPPTPPIPATIQTLACRWMPLGLFDWCRRALGERFTLYPLDLPPVVFLSSPSDIRAVLSAPSAVLRPGAGGKAIAPIVGSRSFMLRDGSEHLRGRRSILPAFSAAALAEHEGRVDEIVRAEIASWPVEMPFAVFPYLRSMSLRIILGTVFRCETARLDRLHRHMLRMLDMTASFVLVEPRLRHLPGWRGIWRRFIRERAAVDEEIRSLIKEARGTRSNDVLGRLAAAIGEGSVDGSKQLRDNLVSIILAGHETTASESAWALQLLSHAPLLQVRLAQEIDGGCGEAYLRATVAEVLRHRPVFLFAIPRVVAQPVEIGGWLYRPPAQLLACIYLLHHDARTYRDPHAFRPERFLDAEPQPDSWLPWGGGQKRCPGHRLATHELQAVIRGVLATRTIFPAARRVERARWRSVIVTPARGGRIQLARRVPGYDIM